MLSGLKEEMLFCRIQIKFVFTSHFDFLKVIFGARKVLSELW